MNPGDPTSAEHFRRRTGILFLILILWGILAAFHILYYSWYRRDRLLRESMHLAWREGVLPQIRGRILAADSTPLAWTELHHDLIIRKPLPSEKQLKNLILQLSGILEELVPEERENHLLLKRDLSPEKILKLEKILSRRSELAVIPRMVRRTADLPGARNTLGETAALPGNPALMGISGLEKEYDAILAGKSGKFRVMLDPRGNWVSGTIEILVPPENGKDVVLPETAFHLPEKNRGTKR